MNKTETVVTQDEFYAALKADKRDIMPCIAEHADRSVWKDKAGVVFGVSFPGWMNPGDPKSYALMKTAS